MLALSGDSVSPTDLRNEFARSLAAIIGGDEPFCELVGCRQTETTSTVVANLEIEVPQKKAHAIEPIEQVAFVFTGDEDRIPYVFALRQGFPEVPHLNMHICERPRMLCLYEESKAELHLRMTPALLIRDTKTWMALNAAGELHQEEQPLEPLMVDTSGFAIMPSGWRNESNRDLVIVSAAKTHGGKFSIRMCFADDPDLPQDEQPDFALLCYKTSPIVHGQIRRIPRTLPDLQDILAPTGFGLVEQLRKNVPRLKKESPKRHLLIMVTVPSKRDLAGNVEAHHTWGFLPGDRTEQKPIDCARIAELLGLNAGWILGSGYPDDHLEEIGIDTLRVIDGVDRPMLAACNITQNADTRIAAIGCGALGSQLISHAARMGFGEWTLIDHDMLLPHNLARHALTYPYVGHSKAVTLAHHASQQSDKQDGFHGLTEDIIDPDDCSELHKRLAYVDLVLDMSASVAVARSISRSEMPRVASFFLSPSGSDLVLLAENTDRSLRLTSLEAQYFRAVSREDTLRQHMRQPAAAVRYSRSCGDISSRIPQWKIAALSGIAMGSLEIIPSSPEASICIWSLQQDGSTVRTDIATAPCDIIKVGPWSVHLDQSLLGDIARMRSRKLPSETGGVLVGSIDFGNNEILLVDALEAPEDSEEWPTHFIRGKSMLPERANAISETTAGNVSYLGEWHSHPDGCGTTASNDDRRLLEFLSSVMSKDGSPGIMAIIGEKSFSLYIQDGSGARPTSATHDLGGA
jgi:proteasome lid subunit RPN8/RPN11